MPRSPAKPSRRSKLKSSFRRCRSPNSGWSSGSRCPRIRARGHRARGNLDKGFLDRSTDGARHCGHQPGASAGAIAWAASTRKTQMVAAALRWKLAIVLASVFIAAHLLGAGFACAAALLHRHPRRAPCGPDTCHLRDCPAPGSPSHRGRRMRRLLRTLRGHPTLRQAVHGQPPGKARSWKASRRCFWCTAMPAIAAYGGG